MELHTRTRADRSFKRRILGGALAVTFAVVGIGAELAMSSPADATVFQHTVYVGDGVYCNYTGSWPYWSCYAP